MAINALKLSIPEEAPVIGSTKKTVIHGHQKHFSITWKIQNFSSSQKKYPNRQFISNNFTVCDSSGDTLTKWCLALVQSRENYCEYYSLFPCLMLEMDYTEEIFVEIRLSFFDQIQGKKCTAFFGETFFDARSMNTSVHLRLENMVQDDFTVVCKMIQRDAQNFSLTKDLGEALKNPNFSDVKLISNDGRVFKAHKLMLAFRSPVFAMMFAHDMKENEDHEVTIEDINGNVMEEFLRFVYVGKSNKLDQLAEGLLSAAEKYDVKGLKMLCEDAFMSKLSIFNAVEVLQLSCLNNATRLKSEVIKFMVIEENSQIFNTQEWKNFKESGGDVYKEICEAFVNSKSPKK